MRLMCASMQDAAPNSPPVLCKLDWGALPHSLKNLELRGMEVHCPYGREERHARWGVWWWVLNSCHQPQRWQAST